LHVSAVRLGAAALALALLAGGVSVARPSAADDATDARTAYDAASRAFEERRHADAARLFAEADALAPNRVALESALKASLLADDPVLTMNLLERADQRGPRAVDQALTKTARERAAPRVGRLRVSCPDERDCVLRLDGAALVAGERRWALAGEYGLEVDVSGAVERHRITLGAGETLDYRPPAPAPAPAPMSSTTPGPIAPTRAPASEPAPLSDALGTERDRGLSPAWVVVGGVVTVALSGLTVWSGVDTLDQHDAFVGGDLDAREPGQNAQLRTNLLLGGALLSAVGTGVLAIFTDWGGSTAPARSAANPARLGLSF
jgi:hypothetical protein